MDEGGHCGCRGGGLKLAEGIGKASRKGWRDKVSKKRQRKGQEREKKKQRGKKKIEGKGKKKKGKDNVFLILTEAFPGPRDVITEIGGE